jgi:hypothetical protein
MEVCKYTLDHLQLDFGARVRNILIHVFFSSCDVESTEIVFEPHWVDMRHHCYGGEFPHRRIFNATEKMMRDYYGTPKFVVEHLLDNHVADQSGMSQMDEDVQNHIANLPLENTIFFLIGDHGIHFEEYSQTDRGKYEHNNPPLIVSVPKSMLKAMPLWERGLQINSNRLITILDLHLTMRALTYAFLNDATRERSLDLSKDIHWNFPGINFFEDVIPLSRTCTDAFIPDTYCNCGTWETHSNVTSVFPRSLQTEVISQALRAAIERGLELSGSNTTKFISSCYIDPFHAAELKHLDQSSLHVMSSNTWFVIKVLSVFKPSLLMCQGDSQRNGSKSDTLFRASFEGSVLTSPGNVVPRFEVIGMYQKVDDTIEISSASIHSVHRQSVYGIEPCRSELATPQAGEFCICADATTFE